MSSATISSHNDDNNMLLIILLIIIITKYYYYYYYYLEQNDKYNDILVTLTTNTIVPRLRKSLHLIAEFYWSLYLCKQVKKQITTQLTIVLRYTDND